ncbi:FGGY-family carbohydrate kinase [Marinicrinis lubricantis]|uniref:FGGY-family carbohydrate kinase n=1 Tax=Marinicrinis lubricantis TaxID=2086470 RepID=A0ABW1IV53_9BACL
MQTELAFLGIDIGTQGVRVTGLLEHGELCASYASPFTSHHPHQVLRQEQDPEDWWRSVVICLQHVVMDLKKRNALTRIHSITVSSTSGTVIPLDRDHRPLSKAIMYSDQRSHEFAKTCCHAAEQSGVPFTAFNSSSGLSKMVWFQHACPMLAEQAAYWIHAADFIVGRLCGIWGVSDETNSLKSGYDLMNRRWPNYIQDALGIPRSSLPGVVPTGTILGPVTKDVAELTGLPPTAHVTVGVTDSCASQIASGAFRPGDWNTTIGTTLVLKGVTRDPIDDPHHRIYNHRHPDGYWMPGGASNTGADWVTLDYSDHELDQLNKEAVLLTPTPWLAYPLKQHGERFPFTAPHAEGFEPSHLTRAEQFAARMEGTAYIERMAYHLVEELSRQKVGQVYTAGGASNSLTWLQIRSDVMRVPILKMKHASGSAGAAVLAASRTHYSNLQEAGSQMVVLDRRIEPSGASLQQQYAERYEAFIQQLSDKGYLSSFRKDANR